MSHKSSAMVRMTALMLVAVCGVAAHAGPRSGSTAGGGSGSGASGGGSTFDPFPELPTSLQVWGTVRDFRESGVPGGHDDFERQPVAGFGHYLGMVEADLGADGKPVMATTGYKVATEWKDKNGRQIMPPNAYVAGKADDVAGAVSTVEGGALTSDSNFHSWFRDIPGVNMSAAIPIELIREPGTNRFVYDDSLDPRLMKTQGFFVVNDQLLGNSQGGNKNFHFTYEIDAEFEYTAGMGQYFTFSGNDDVWVFIDDKLVVDLGGVRARVTQTIDLDRVAGLVNGEKFHLKFFFAQRHRTESRFRIETNMMLRSIQPPATSATFD